MRTLTERAWQRSVCRFVRGAAPILVFLALWEMAARVGLLRPVVVPAFSTVAQRWTVLLLHGDITTDAIISLYRAGVGFVLAGILGVTVGLAMARNSIVNWFFEPLIAIGFPTPTITLIPVFILWFGIGHASKILLVALTCFFPIALSSATGARHISQQVIWSAQAMGTSEGQVLRRVILPAALPFILSAMRIALPLSLIVAFVAEMVGGGGGLGYALVYGYRFLDTPTVFAVLLTVLVLGLFLDRALLLIRRRLLPWDVEAERGRDDNAS